MNKNMLSRRQFLAISAAVSATALAACAAPAAAPQAGGAASAPAAAPVEILHWIYINLPMDRTTLQSVPADETENVIGYFDWSAEAYKEQTPEVEVKLEMLPHDQSWFAKLDATLVAGTPPDVVQGPVSEAAKYVPLGALSRPSMNICRRRLPRICIRR